MEDSSRDIELAEAYWRNSVEPLLRPIVIGAYVEGAKAVRKSVSDWLSAAPGIRVETADGTAARADVVEGSAERSARSSASLQGRPLRGAGLAAYEIVERDGPLTSRELLGELRKREGGKKNDERDNTLLAAIRRLRKAGRLSYDGTHYTLPPPAAEASAPPGTKFTEE